MSISRGEARAHLERFTFVDPCGFATVDSCLLGASCYALESPQGRVVFALKASRPRAWVTVAAGMTTCTLSPALNAALARITRAAGCASVAFQTARPGLVRRARRLGWREVGPPLPRGWVMERGVRDAND